MNLNRQKSDDDDSWKVFTFDARNAPDLKSSLSEVKKILLFIEPGKKDIDGTFYIDDIEFAGDQIMTITFHSRSNL